MFSKRFDDNFLKENFISLMHDKTLIQINFRPKLIS